MKKREIFILATVSRVCFLALIAVAIIFEMDYWAICIPALIFSCFVHWGIVLAETPLHIKKGEIYQLHSLAQPEGTPYAILIWLNSKDSNRKARGIGVFPRVKWAKGVEPEPNCFYIATEGSDGLELSKLS